MAGEQEREKDEGGVRDRRGMSLEAGLPPPGLVFAAIDWLYQLLDCCACNDPRAPSVEFSVSIEAAIDRLADLRAHVRNVYSERGE